LRFESTSATVLGIRFILGALILAMKRPTPQYLIARAEICICLRLIAEVSSLEKGAVSIRVHRACSRDMGQHACRFARRCLLSIRITGIGHNVEGLHSERSSSRFSHWQQTAIVCSVQHHLVSHDQGVLGVNRALHVVGRKCIPPHQHEADLRLRVSLELLQGRFYCSRTKSDLLLLIRFLHAVQITLQLEAFPCGVDARHGPELAAVYGNPLAPDKPATLCKLDQLRSRRRNRVAMHAPELSDRLVIRIEPSQQPHQFHVAAALRLQPARRTYLIQIAVQV